MRERHGRCGSDGQGAATRSKLDRPVTRVARSAPRWVQRNARAGATPCLGERCAFCERSSQAAAGIEPTAAWPPSGVNGPGGPFNITARVRSSRIRSQGSLGARTKLEAARQGHACGLEFAHGRLCLAPRPAARAQRAGAPCARSPRVSAATCCARRREAKANPTRPRPPAGRGPARVVRSRASASRSRPPPQAGAPLRDWTGG